MPTGYTSKIYDGEQVSGKEFIMTCARAFGALVTMRDESLNVEIPEEFKPNFYYKDQLEKAKEELKKYTNMTIEEAKPFIEDNYNNKIIAKNNSIKENDNLKQRYETVLKEVEKWTPPSNEHIGLKNYAINQLKESIKHDCNNYDYEIKNESPEEHIKNNIERCLKDIDYYTKEWNKEVERVEERNLWVKQLRESLK